MDTEREIVVAEQPLVPSRWLADWATDRFGLVTATKLAAMHVSRQQRRTMLDDGWLLPTVHRGVYRVGHQAPIRGQREALALAAGGRRAALHGWSAAGWLGLCDPPPGAVRLIDPDRKSGRIDGARRVRGELGEDVIEHDGLRTTTTLRTLLDLPAQAPRSTLREALVAALRQGHDLQPLHATAKGRRGAHLLRSELELLFPELAHTLSELEALFLRLLHQAGIRLPTVNVHHHDRIVDCRWPDTTLIVELDGRRWHEHHFQHDRDRDDTHTLDGLRTLRFTWQDLTDRPDHVLDQVGRALAA